MGIPIFRAPGTGLGADDFFSYDEAGTGDPAKVVDAAKSNQMQGSNIAKDVIGGLKDIANTWFQVKNQSTPKTGGVATPKPGKPGAITPTAKDNTGLYVGLGIAAVAVVGLGLVARGK